jgi:hypothetical protein
MYVVVHHPDKEIRNKKLFFLFKEVEGWQSQLNAYVASITCILVAGFRDARFLLVQHTKTGKIYK